MYLYGWLSNDVVVCRVYRVCTGFCKHFDGCQEGMMLSGFIVVDVVVIAKNVRLKVYHDTLQFCPTKKTCVTCDVRLSLIHI